MTELHQLLKHALADEPALPITAADLARRGRRRGLVRAAGGVATGLVLVSGAAAVVFGVASDRDDAEHGTPAAAEASAVVSSPARTTTDVITARTLPSIVESRGDLELDSVRSQNPDETTYVNLSAGVTSVAGKRAAHQYLNVQVFPREKGSPWPDCYGVSDLAKDGDGYFGPCTVRVLPDGNRLLERGGTTKSGGFAITEATLVRKDSSGVTAEVTNQRVPNSHKRSPVVSARPPVSSAQLADLVQQLAELPLRR